MNYAEMGLCIAAIAAIAPFAYRLLPERAKKPMLTEKDLDALDARVKLYERLSRVEDRQAIQGEQFQEFRTEFKSDVTLLFSKIDDVKDTIMKERKS